jgi:hypothetical protein
MVSIQSCIISQNNKEIISYHYLYPSSHHVRIIYAPVRYKQELHIKTDMLLTQVMSMVGLGELAKIMDVPTETQ